MGGGAYEVGDEVVHKVTNHICAGRIGVVKHICDNHPQGFDCYVHFGGNMGAYATFENLKPAPKTRFNREVV